MTQASPVGPTGPTGTNIQTTPTGAAPLEGLRVLVVEDEWFLAMEVEVGLQAAGATVLGPIPGVAEAMALLDAEPRPDAAVLDVNLGGEMVYPVADRLLAEGVLVILTTGYAERDIPDRYAEVPRCTKPVEIAWIARAVREALGQDWSTTQRASTPTS